jgi:hypothetical protein
MFYYLYQITNKLNGMIYIGIHKTKNLDDGYMGSGSYLKNAKLKYGIENFEKTILAHFSSDEELLKAEADLVSEEFISREDVYNLVRGGVRNSFDVVNERGLNLYGKNGQSGYGLENLTNGSGGKTLKEVLIERGTWESYKDKLSESILKMYENGYTNPFKDKKHTDQTKKKIGAKNAIHQKGENNSQFGTMWVYNTVTLESKKINKTELLEGGWVKGRKINGQ